MKLININILFFILFHSFSAYSQTKTCCLLIDSILHYPQIKSLLELDSIKDKKPIRIIRPPKTTFFSCSSLFKDSKNKFIPIKTIQNVPFDLNTGNYRDIVIAKINCNKNNTVIEVYLSNYRWNNIEKNRWHFTFYFTSKNNNIVISDVKFALWD